MAEQEAVAQDDTFAAPPTDTPATPTSPSRDPETGRFVAQQPSAEPAATPAPSAPQHSAYLTRMAQELGLSDLEISNTPTEQLGDRVHWMYRQREALREQSLRETAARFQPQQPVAQQQPEPPVDDLGLDEDVHPSIKNAFQKLAKENQQLKQHLASVAQQNHAREQQTIQDRADGVFATLDPAVWGTGSGRTMRAESPEYMRRFAVFVAAQQSQEPIAFEEKIRRAAARLFPTAAAPPSPPAPNGEGAQRFTEQQWNGAGLAPAIKRAPGAEPKGVPSAKRAFLQGLREAGLDDLSNVSQDTAADTF